MFMSDWSALMTPPEGQPGQHAYTVLICILSTSLTSVSNFFVCCYSWWCGHSRSLYPSCPTRPSSYWLIHDKYVMTTERLPLLSSFSGWTLWHHDGERAEWRGVGGTRSRVQAREHRNYLWVKYFTYQINGESHQMFPSLTFSDNLLRGMGG